MMRVCQKEPIARDADGQTKNILSNKINKVAMDYNPKNKMNIHESILMLNE